MNELGSNRARARAPDSDRPLHTKSEMFLDFVEDLLVCLDSLLCCSRDFNGYLFDYDSGMGWKRVLTRVTLHCWWGAASLPNVYVPFWSHYRVVIFLCCCVFCYVLYCYRLL